MKKAACVLIGALTLGAIPGASVAVPFVLLSESDPGGLNNLVLSRYATLTDLINLNSSGNNLLPTIASGVSISGLTAVLSPASEIPEPSTLRLLLGFGGW
jgi:hypothetical protein